VSIGVAVAPDHGTDVTSLLETADRSLYAAKSAGRDGFVSAR
jgi:GGDEF domain-containing protein